MAAHDWAKAVADALEDRRVHHTLRRRRTVRVLDSTHLEIDGRRFVNFASNNYLGLTHHPSVVAAFASAAKMVGVGSGAAPLITGQTEFHASAERTIAAWKGTESAVLLSSGYAANLAVVQTLAGVAEKNGVRFLIDKLCHASIVDSVRAVSSGDKATFRVFPHNHLAKLRRLLAEADANVLQVVITESIFSMDGDVADLRGIAELKREFPFLLVLDEAHASGVYGSNGSGYAAELGLSEIVDIAIITLSKALGSVGGAVCGSSQWCEALVNFGRSYVFSTAIPPAIAAAVEAGIGVMKDQPQRQQRVRLLAARLRAGLGLPPGDSPIVPIILGEESKALDAAERLMDQRIFAVAVRPPTVPRGSSRLRVTVSCDHTDDELNALINALNKGL
jgi:8-amino-7-oxononanoate synthase